MLKGHFLLLFMNYSNMGTIIVISRFDITKLGKIFGGDFGLFSQALVDFNIKDENRIELEMQSCR